MAPGLAGDPALGPAGHEQGGDGEEAGERAGRATARRKALVASGSRAGPGRTGRRAPSAACPAWWLPGPAGARGRAGAAGAVHRRRDDRRRSGSASRRLRPSSPGDRAPGGRAGGGGGMAGWRGRRLAARRARCGRGGGAAWPVTTRGRAAGRRRGRGAAPTLGLDQRLGRQVVLGGGRSSGGGRRIGRGGAAGPSRWPSGRAGLGLARLALHLAGDDPGPTGPGARRNLGLVVCHRRSLRAAGRGPRRSRGTAPLIWWASTRSAASEPTTPLALIEAVYARLAERTAAARHPPRAAAHPGREGALRPPGGRSRARPGRLSSGAGPTSSSSPTGWPCRTPPPRWRSSSSPPPACPGCRCRPPSTATT